MRMPSSAAAKPWKETAMSDGKTDYIAEAITEAFGPRCSDYVPDCHCCRAWRQYDAIPDPATIRREALEEAANVGYAAAVKHCSARDGMTLIGHPVGHGVA